MKKKIGYFLVLIIIAPGLFAQNAYYDALFLRKHTKGQIITLDSMVLTVLHQYYSEINANSDITDVRHSFATNPFLDDFAFNGQGLADRGFLGLGNYKSFVGKVAGVDVTAFSQGLSQFMIDRAREELNIAFFNRFKRYVEKNNEIKLLFPLSTTRLENLLSYHYALMLPQLRQAFYEDFQNLPDNMIVMMEKGNSFEALREDPHFILVLNSFTLMRKLEYISPPDFFEQLPELTGGIPTEEMDSSMMNFYTSLVFTSVLSSSLTDTSETRHWVPSNEVYTRLIKDTIALRFYLGLVYQEIANENIETHEQSLTGFFNQHASDLACFEEILMQIAAYTSKIDTHLEQINELKVAEKKLKAAYISDYINTTIEIVKFGYKTIGGAGAESVPSRRYLDYVDKTNRIVKYSVSEQFPAAILEVVELIQNIYQVEKGFDEIDHAPEWLSQLIVYGTFMAGLIEAGTPEEAKNAIAAAALPAGSSSIKKYADINVAVNGYLGASYRIDYKKDNAVNAWNSQWAVSAPVGLTLSTGFKRRGAVSLTGVLLDIGAIVDYQLANDSTTIESKIRLGNIVSPGGYMVYNAGANLPLSIGIGAQYGPGLSSVNADNIAVLNGPNWRVGVFLAVDIPMFTIFNRPKQEYGCP